MNWAATLDEAIKRQMEGTAPNDFIRAIVIMSQQANIRRIAGTNAKISALQQIANQTQQGLNHQLSEGVREGSVKSYRSFWIFNGVQVIATPKMVEQLAKLPEVRVILPEVFYPLPRLFFDKARSGQGSIEKNPPAKRVWEEFQITGKGVTVGVLGTGAELSVANLSASYRGGEDSWFDACAGRAKPYDEVGLGTAMLSALIGLGVDQQPSGIAPGAKWVAAKVMTSEGGYASWLYAGLQWMADPDGNPQTQDAPQAINLPLSKADLARDLACAKAVDNLCQMGVFCVLSVGVDVDIPPRLREVPIPANPFAVGALDEQDRVALFGKRRAIAFHPRIVPELSAPATNLRVVSIDGKAKRGSGEMLACAQVMGTVALLLQAEPRLTLADLQWALKRTASDLGVPGTDRAYGAGKLDVYAAVRYVLGDFLHEGERKDGSEPGLMITTLEIVPQQLVLEMLSGQMRTQTVMISNRGRHTESLGISVEEPKRWLDFEPELLIIAPGAVGILTISCDTRLLDVGNYAAEILIESELENTVLPIELSVRPWTDEKRDLSGLGAPNRPGKSTAESDGFAAIGNEASGGASGNSNNSQSDDSGDDHSDSRSSGTRISFGNEEFGEIGRPGDQDYFLFEGKKGDSVTIEIVSQIIGSSLDSYIYLYAPDGRELVRNDDSERGLDSSIDDYKLPEDGQYAIRVRDFRNRGGPGMHYVVSLSK